MDIRHLLVCVTLVLSACQWAEPTPGENGTPLDVSTRKQLFIDRRFIAESNHIELHMNPAQKLGLIRNENDQPWTEGSHVSRVIEDQGKIKLYLGADGVAVYESDDAIHFKNTGITIPGTFATVFLDPHDTPERRYKVFWTQFSSPYNAETDGVLAAYSTDGVKFTPAGRVLPLFVDNPCVSFWDERINRYVIFTRTFDYGSENQRRIGRIETEDILKPWPYTKLNPDKERLSIENVPPVLQADGEDDPHSDIYYNSASIYPWAQEVYLMFTAQFRHFSPDRNPYIRPRSPGQWEDFGLLEVQLATSRDGITWERISREPYFPTGLADEWDRWYAVMGPGIIRHGNYLYQYYCSTGRTHDSVILRPEYDNLALQMGGIGVVRQRLDGFISADADHRGGWLETPPVIFNGAKLRLNIDTGGMGRAFVELRDTDEKPIPGYTQGECEEIAGNYIDEAVHWNGKTDVTALAGRPIKIRFNLLRTKLYSFQFTNE
jgi:hypothetical protein